MKWEGKERPLSDVMRSNQYFAMLKDPRWQKRRNEKLVSVDYQCEYCGRGINDGMQLHVHHRWYLKGRAPWEYTNDQLEVLCEQHHKMAGNVHDHLKERLSRLPLWAQIEIVQGCYDNCSSVDVILDRAFYG